MRWWLASGCWICCFKKVKGQAGSIYKTYPKIMLLQTTLLPRDGMGYSYNYINGRHTIKYRMTSHMKHTYKQHNPLPSSTNYNFLSSRFISHKNLYKTCTKTYHYNPVQGGDRDKHYFGHVTSPPPPLPRDTVSTYRVSFVAYVGQQGEGYAELEHRGSELLLLLHQGSGVPRDVLHLQ